MASTRPPLEPYDWHPLEKKMGHRAGPGEFELTEHQAADPNFAAFAHLAWTDGRGYLRDWLWQIFDKARGEAKREKWEHRNGRKG